MKNDIDDLLNSVFGSRTLRTGGQGGRPGEAGNATSDAGA